MSQTTSSSSPPSEPREPAALLSLVTTDCSIYCTDAITWLASANTSSSALRPFDSHSHN